MCLVSVLGKGKEKYSDKVTEFITKGFSCNRDGSGYMFKRNGENVITVNKGFFKDVSKLLEAIEAEKLTVDDELVVHHRISTSGLVSPANCHPFVVSTDHEECSATKITIDKPCLVHNGMFSYVSYYMNKNNDFSDTYAFTRYIMANPNILNIFREDKYLFDSITDKFISGSRVAILQPDGPLVLIGNFIENDGYYHSNSGYCSYVHNAGGVESGWDENGKWKRPGGTSASEYYSALAEEAAKDRKLLGRGSESHGEYPSIKKHISDRLKEPMFLKFNASMITISDRNCHHFKYVSKNEYIAFVREHKSDDNLDSILKEMLKYAKEAKFQSLTYREKGISVSEGISNQSLVNGYLYIVRDAYRLSYKGYIQLLDSIDQPGKQTWKKVKNMVQKNRNKAYDCTVYFKRFKQFYTKLALELYLDHLELNGYDKKESVEDYGKAEITTVDSGFGPIIDRLELND